MSLLGMLCLTSQTANTALNSFHQHVQVAVLFVKVATALPLLLKLHLKLLLLMQVLLKLQLQLLVPLSSLFGASSARVGFFFCGCGGSRKVVCSL